MFLIDFQKTRRQAFFHGFMKGLGAPVLLYHYEAAPGLPSVFQVGAPHTPIDQALRGDWFKVGCDVRAVVTRHQNEIARVEHTTIKKHGKQALKAAAKKSRSKRR